MQKDTFVKFFQCRKIPQGIRIRLKNQLETFKKKIEENVFEFFSKTFLMKVSGKSHSAEYHKESYMLAKRFVSSENSGATIFSKPLLSSLFLLIKTN